MSTYQELLAGVYAENAGNLLAYPETEYDDVEEAPDVDQITAHELEEPEEFQRFAGDRGTEDIVFKPNPFGESALRRIRDLQTHIFNIDSSFRAYAVAGFNPVPAALVRTPTYISQVQDTATSLSSHFSFSLDSLYKNIISASVSTLQLPNTFFNLVDIRNNYYVYAKKGAFADAFVIPISGITGAGTNVIVSFSSKISPFVVGDSITLASTTNYNHTYTIHASTPTSITIKTTFLGAETPMSGTATCSVNLTNVFAGYTQVAVYITSVHQSPRSVQTAVLTEAGSNGFLYTNTSIIPAVSSAMTPIFPDLVVSQSNGYTTIQNTSSSTTYTLNITPESSGLNPAYFPPLGAMLGFYNYVYSVAHSTTLTSEMPINMNADPYLQLVLADWENVNHQDGEDSFTTLFLKIPVNVAKGSVIDDIVYKNSMTRKLNFQQPTNVETIEIALLDRVGNGLLMPGVDWSMTLELEEVLNAGLYNTMRELN